jgi:hypothetical protein
MGMEPNDRGQGSDPPTSETFTSGAASQYSSHVVRLRRLRL